MPEQYTLPERLQALVELNMKKKRNLSKSEKEEVVSILSVLCIRDEEGYHSVMEALAELPSEVGALLLSTEWQKLLEANRPVVQDLQTTSFNSDLGKRLRISLAQRLILIDPESAFRLLHLSFKNMKHGKNPLPTIKDLSLIRSALIQPGHQSLDSLPLQNASAGATLLIQYILAAAFIHKTSQRPLDAPLQMKLLRWANRCPKVFPLPKELQEAVGQAIKAWDEGSQRLLAQEMDAFQPTIRDLLITLRGIGKTGSVESGTNLKDSKTTTPASTWIPSSPQTQPYDALNELERLGRYIKSIKRKLDQTQQELQRTSLDLDRTGQDLAAARKERGNAQRELAALQHSNQRLSIEKGQLRQEVEALQGANETLRGELDDDRSLFENTVTSHREHLDTLSKRIEHEGEHRIEIFRNALGAQIQTYANDLNEAAGMEMTIDLGNALRNQMRQLFRILKNEGVNINGGA